MKIDSVHDVLIIGAGPAGLSLAYECGRRGLQVHIVEAGAAPGAAWRRMPTGLRLLSPWYQNVLFDRRWRLRDLFRLVPAGEFANYLDAEAKRHALSVSVDQVVQGVSKHGDIWIVDAGSRYYARNVVCASGYYSKPYTPTIEGQHSLTIPQLHFNEYVSPGALPCQRRNARVLIVGKRISAGQAAVELADAGFGVTLVCRSAIRFARPPWLQTLSFPLYFAFEDWVAAKRTDWLDDSYPPMDGGRAAALIRSGIISTRPGVRAFSGNAATFTDGTQAAFDLVLYATGFRPALDYLGELSLPLAANGLPRTEGFALPDYPGLYLLGFDKLRTFRSRYLRGIREDARVLAETILAELGRRSV